MIGEATTIAIAETIISKGVYRTWPSQNIEVNAA